MSDPQGPARRAPVLKIMAGVVGAMALAHVAVVAAAWMTRPASMVPDCLASASPDGALLVRACRVVDDRFRPLKPARYDYALATPGAGRGGAIIGSSAKAPTSFPVWQEATTVRLCGLGVTPREAGPVAVRDGAGELRRVTAVTDCT